MPIILGGDLAAYLGNDDGVDATRLDRAAAAASAAVQQYCGRDFDKTPSASPTAKTFRATDFRALRVPDFWSTTGLVVATDDNNDGTFETTWTINTDFIVEGPEDGWPYDRILGLGTRSFPFLPVRKGIQVTAAWGWESVPSAVVEATLIKAARLFKRKESPEGVLGGWAEFGAVRVSLREDPDVVMLLGPYRRATTAVTVA